MSTLDLLAQATQAAQADADTIQAATAVMLAQRDQIAELDALAAAQVVTLAERDAVIRDQAATISAQAARIAELEAIIGPPPPPPAPTMLIGASVQRRGAESWAQALDRFEDLIGVEVQAVRRFISGRPPANPATHSALADVLDGKRTALRLIAVSFTAGTVDEIVTFLRGLPVIDKLRYAVAIRHEPDKELRVSGPDFRAMCDDLITAVDIVGRDDVDPMFVLMSWLERDGNPSTSSLDYMPRTNLNRWIMGLDPYFGKDENTYDSQAGSTIALWRGLGGRRIALTEWGVKSTGQTAADQITGIHADAEEDGCEFALYFDSAEGTNAGAGWYLDMRGPEAVAAFAAAIQP